MSFTCTVIGLILVCAGVSCSLRALARQAHDHGRRPIPEAINRVLTVARQLGYRLAPWRRRNVIVHDGVVGAVLAGPTFSARGTVSAPSVPSDVGAEEQIRFLIQRIENIEKQAENDRVQHGTLLRRLDERIDSSDDRARQAHNELQQVTRGIAVGTIELQLWGLILVGAGTILMAMPALFG